MPCGVRSALGSGLIVGLSGQNVGRLWDVPFRPPTASVYTPNSRQGQTPPQLEPYEPWHFRYFGRIEARAIYDSG